jgi:DNA invertase Pin-like site-specific DNA recombinase
MATVGYVRVSSVTQKTDRQDFEGYTLDKTFIDKASGSSRERPQLKACLEYLREGDLLLVHSIDRLARNSIDLQHIVSDLIERSISVRFIKESLEFNNDSSAMSKLMLQLLGAIGEFERAVIRERQAEGIAKAKAKGVYKGRKPSLNADQIKEIRDKVRLGVPKAKLAKEYKVSRLTIYNALT